MEHTVKGIVQTIEAERILLKILNREIKEVYIEKSQFPEGVQEGDYIEIIDRKIYIK